MVFETTDGGMTLVLRGFTAFNLLFFFFFGGGGGHVRVRFAPNLIYQIYCYCTIHIATRSRCAI